MTTSPVPSYVAEEWEPVKMTRKVYNDRRAHLLAQHAAAEAVVAAYETAYAPAVAHRSLSLHDMVGAAWNAAHDVVTALEFAIADLDSEWRWRDVDPYQRFLVANNVD